MRFRSLLRPVLHPSWRLGFIRGFRRSTVYVCVCVCQRTFLTTNASNIRKSLPLCRCGHRPHLLEGMVCPAQLFEQAASLCSKGRLQLHSDCDMRQHLLLRPLGWQIGGRLAIWGSGCILHLAAHPAALEGTLGRVGNRL